MGGLIGQWLGLNAGDRLQRLVLCNTAARIGTAESWAARLEGLATSSMASVADGAIARWFTDGFATANPTVVQGIREQVATCDAAGYVANCAAIRDADFRANLADIRVPTLIVAGRHDAGTTVDDAMVLADGIPDSRVLVLDAAHLSNVAERQPFNAAILDFLHP
jgi:3-oxoadipate enol-lactonase